MEKKQLTSFIDKYHLAGNANSVRLDIKDKKKDNLKHKTKTYYKVLNINNNHKIISCPGCYPTSIQIPLVPIIKNKLIDTKDIIIDSKSGYSGAGKNLHKKFKYKNIY